ncbi:MAG: hypothetical protein U0325_24230 [Polyangiales bacterium]
MVVSRIFIAQDALDAWVAEGKGEVQRDELLDRSTGRRFRLREGLRFLSEVTGAPDTHGLVGRVKDLDQLAALNGEHMADSVIIGDNAYQVQQGFVGSVIASESRPDVAALAAAMAPPAGPAEAPGAQRQTIAALQAFFLNNVK